jgi:hypothetical protein
LAPLRGQSNHSAGLLAQLLNPMLLTCSNFTCQRRTTIKIQVGDGREELQLDTSKNLAVLAIS